jgi:hypothetical protein
MQSYSIYRMELYTNSLPILISERVTTTYSKLMEDMSKQNLGIFQKLYENIIQPNLGLSILVSLILIFLIWRYISFRNNKKEQFQRKLGTTLKGYPNRVRYFSGMDSPNERIARPTFNPSIPIQKQQSYVNYLPDTIPVNHNGKFVNNVQEMQYTAPANNANTFQYTGPFYDTGENGVSDDMYDGFVEYNKQNLLEFDDILSEKINIV